MTWKVLWVVVLVACGRIGFEGATPGLGDAAPNPDNEPGAISLRVLTDDAVDRSTLGGSPVIGATVLIDRGGGDDERLATDAQGEARFDAADVQAFHVVYRDPPTQWRVYTVSVDGVREIELGGRTVETNTMTVTLPDGIVNDDYKLMLPHGCSIPGNYDGGSGNTATLTVEYLRACEGQQVRAVTYAFQTQAGSARYRYFDAGTMLLSSGSRQVLEGVYQDLPVRSL